MYIQDQRGFSLIETLVAAVILFSVLTSSFLAFQGAIIGSTKAQLRIQLLKTVPKIRAEITDKLQIQGLTSGAGAVGDVPYDWAAQLHTTGIVFNIESESGAGANTPAERQLSLWHVAVVVGIEGSEREFAFTELSWSG